MWPEEFDALLPGVESIEDGPRLRYRLPASRRDGQDRFRGDSMDFVVFADWS